MMRFPRLFAAPAVVLAGLTFTAVHAQELETDTEKLSYVIGMDVGRSIQGLDMEVDIDALTRAVTDVLEGKDLALTDEDAEAVKKAYFEKRQAEAQAEAGAVANANMEASQKYLEANKAREGVEVTESGLQYEVLEEGDGPKPTDGDKVKVDYRGTLIDGTQFDSSYDRGEPATFPLSGVIPGWTEGLQLMPVGSKYRFVIPPELAYGERGAGNQIGPNNALVFEVELLEIVSE